MHQIENRASMMSNRRGWAQGCRVPTEHLGMPSRRGRESQVFIRCPLQRFRLDHSSFTHTFSSAQFIIDGVPFLKPPPILKTNFFFKPVQVRTNQLVQKRKAQTCITDDMFGRKVEKWTFQRLGKEWVKRPRLASKREALSNRCSRCRAQSLVLLTFLEPWEMRAKVLNSIILHPSWSSVEDICLSLIL